MTAHIYDLSLSAEALKRAANWPAVQRGRGDVPITVATCDCGQIHMKTAGDETGGEQITLTRAALQAAAEWATAGPSMGEVFLLADDTTLLVYQGDDRAGFDTDGSPASEEYLAVAPLDR
jgi:hypothetical protein